MCWNITLVRSILHQLSNLCPYIANFALSASKTAPTSRITKIISTNHSLMKWLPWKAWMDRGSNSSASSAVRTWWTCTSWTTTCWTLTERRGRLRIGFVSTAILPSSLLRTGECLTIQFALQNPNVFCSDYVLRTRFTIAHSRSTKIKNHLRNLHKIEQSDKDNLSSQLVQVDFL